MAVVQCRQCKTDLVVGDPHDECFFCCGPSHDVPTCKQCEQLQGRGTLIRYVLHTVWEIHKSVVPLEGCRTVLAENPIGLSESCIAYMKEIPGSPNTPSIDADLKDAALSGADARWPSFAFRPPPLSFSTFLSTMYDQYARKGDAAFPPHMSESAQQSSSLVDYDHSDVEGDYVEDQSSIEVSKSKLINTASAIIVKDKGWQQEEIIQEPHPNSLLGLFSTYKRDTPPSMPVPHELLQLNESLSEKELDVVPRYLRHIYRVKEQDYALLAHHVPDDILIASTPVVFKGGKPCLKDEKLDSCTSFMGSSVMNMGDMIRALSVSCHAASHVWSVLDELNNTLNSDQPSLAKATELVDKAFPSIQLAQTAAFDASSMLLKQKSASSRFIRKIWLEESSLSKEVKFAAKQLPLPLGSLDSAGNVSRPAMFGPSLDSMVDAKYKQKKHLEKVSVVRGGAYKRPAQSSHQPPKKKNFVMDLPRESSSQQTRGRGRGRGGRGRSRGRGRRGSNRGAYQQTPPSQEVKKDF